jgi:hypothetical protein
LRDMVKAGQVIKEKGRYSVPTSATVSTASPPPIGGVAVRRAAADDDGAESDSDDSDDDDGGTTHDSLVRTLRDVKNRRTLSNDQWFDIPELVDRGYVVLQTTYAGVEWLEDEG